MLTPSKKPTLNQSINTPSELLEILFEDEHYIAINKPNGLLVHRTNIAADVEDFALQRLRNQVGYHVFPVHRLDRPTSGILVFGKSKEATAALANHFQEKTIRKTYLAVVRGFAPEEGIIDHPLKKDNGQLQNASTAFKRLGTNELDIPVKPFPTARYSLVAAWPHTGRMHQIRKHFAHLRHYIIGDKTHGETHHTKMFKEKLNCTQMLLHAYKLEFEHPISKQNIVITAKLPEHFSKIVMDFGWSDFTA